MIRKNKLKLLLFFSYNYDLQKWHESGILSREINYYEELINKFGIEVTFLTYGKVSDADFLPENSKIKILNIFKKKKYGSFLNFFYSIFFILFNRNISKYDLFKTNQNYGSWLAVISKIIYQKPLISRGGYDLFHFKTQEKNLFKIACSYIICFVVYKIADKVVIPSFFYKKFIINKFNIKKDKIYVVPNYVDNKNFKFLKRSFKKKLKFVFIGRLEKQKNINYLIELFKKIPMNSLDIIGFGSQNQKILKMITNYKNINIINKKFNNDQINELLNKYDCFVLPSKFEGCPKILLEAMFNGLLCFTFKVPNIFEIIGEEANGIYFTNNIDKMINKLQNLNNYELKNIVLNASNHVKKKFHINEILKAEINILKGLNDKKKHR